MGYSIVGRAVRAQLLAVAYCESPKLVSNCSAERAPTTAIGCWPGRKNAIVGRVMIWSA